MSKRFLNPLRLVNLPSDPATGSEGDMYWNTVDKVIKIYNGTTWNPAGGNPNVMEVDGGSASSTYMETLDGGVA